MQAVRAHAISKVGTKDPSHAANTIADSSQTVQLEFAMDIDFVVTWTAPVPGREKNGLEFVVELEQYLGQPRRSRPLHAARRLPPWERARHIHGDRRASSSRRLGDK
jgi:hypothetical protein